MGVWLCCLPEAIRKTLPPGDCLAEKKVQNNEAKKPTISGGARGGVIATRTLHKRQTMLSAVEKLLFPVVPTGVPPA